MNATPKQNGLSLRLAVIYVLVMAVIVPLIIGKLLYIQVWEGKKLKQNAIPATPLVYKILPDRGNIYAAGGEILSRSISAYQLFFDPLAMSDTIFQKNLDSLALCLSDLFRDLPAKDYRQRLWNARYGTKPNRYLPLARRAVNDTELRKIKKFPILRGGANVASGLIVDQKDDRKYPYHDLASRTIGYLYMGDDGIPRGKVGLEAAYDRELRGKPGLNRRQMISGLWVLKTEEEPVHGYDVMTTIDVDYQDIVHEALEKQLKIHQAASGVAILMEVKTGDIKAIANLTKKNNAYTEVLNNAIYDAEDPGSTFKAAVMIALLEDGYVHPGDTVDLDVGDYKYGNFTLSESTKRYIGKVTVQQIFERSLNGISTLVYKHYATNPRKFVDRLYQMQLNKPLGVEIEGEGQPLIRYPKDAGWSGVSLPLMSIGYEVRLTPLQMLAFYNALANDGKRVKPRFVKEIRNGDEVVRRVPVEVTDRSVCSRETLGHLRKMMEGVVDNEGTAHNIRGAEYGIAGKTGTAKVVSSSGGYNGGHRASFAGYFPAKDPLYSCIVVVERPSQKSYYGNVVAGNAFREISDKVYALVSAKHSRPAKEVDAKPPVSKNGYKPDLLTLYDALDIRVEERGTEKSPWVLSSRAERGVVLQPRVIDLSVVPNARGMGLRDALYVLENSGLKVGVSGSGMVMKQTIEPGRKVARGSYIHIELR
ncbi:MAG: transpeptidase family protein [Odoribacteraceae bacterium]|jgi:cell division protein FtsI (penicillin-binding protein 3)|nr:transpeptidase family protein [Odoribacteraceae bacterium]